MFALYRYTSLFQARAQGKKDYARETDFIYNFKKFGKHDEDVRRQIELVARHFGCETIAVVPGSKPDVTRLQGLFPQIVTRTKEVAQRKYGHTKPLDAKYGSSVAVEREKLVGKILVVDDICTTGVTLRYFADVLLKDHETVKFALGMNPKLELKEAAIIEDDQVHDSEILACTVSAETLCKFIGITRGRLSQIAGDNADFPKLPNGRYPLLDCIIWRLKNSENLNAERTRLTAAQADIEEIKLSKMRGELCPLEVVEKIVSEALAATKTHFITLRAKLVPQLIGITDSMKLGEVLEKEIYDALIDASTIPERLFGAAKVGFGDPSADVEPVAAPAKAAGKRVGRSKKKVESGGVG